MAVLNLLSQMEHVLGGGGGGGGLAESAVPGTIRKTVYVSCLITQDTANGTIW